MKSEASVADHFFSAIRELNTSPAYTIRLLNGISRFSVAISHAPISSKFPVFFGSTMQRQAGEKNHPYCIGKENRICRNALRLQLLEWRFLQLVCLLGIPDQTW
jgi:hypothetical protein